MITLAGVAGECNPHARILLSRVLLQLVGPAPSKGKPAFTQQARPLRASYRSLEIFREFYSFALRPPSWTVAPKANGLEPSLMSEVGNPNGHQDFGGSSIGSDAKLISLFSGSSHFHFLGYWKTFSSSLENENG